MFPKRFCYSKMLSCRLNRSFILAEDLSPCFIYMYNQQIAAHFSFSILLPVQLQSLLPPSLHQWLCDQLVMCISLATPQSLTVLTYAPLKTVPLTASGFSVLCSDFRPSVSFHVGPKCFFFICHRTRLVQFLLFKPSFPHLQPGMPFRRSL